MNELNSKEIIVLNNICRHYGTGNAAVKALDDVSLSISSGEFAAITGHSGSGKSTLMNILGCLDTPDSGNYILCGKNTAEMSEKELVRVRNRLIGFIFQGFNLIPTMSALENVELPLIYRGMDKLQRHRLALDALGAVGLYKRKDHLPSQMSGGQCQRVAIARAIAAEPALILADEPTGNLDSASGNDVTKLLIELWKQGHTIVLITHDDSLAQQTQRIIRISDGQISSDTQKNIVHKQI